jgi:flagellar biosynthesis chaperone FliJ
MAGVDRHLHTRRAAVRDFERLARVRSIWERQARVKLGEANQDVTQATEASTDALSDHRRHLEATGTAPASAAELLARRLGGMATHDRYAAAEVIRGQADRRMRAAQGSWRRSAQELDIARSLEERRKQALAYAARRAAEATLDELMALRTGRKS